MREKAATTFATNNGHLLRLFDVALINGYFNTHYTPDDLSDWPDWEVQDTLAYIRAITGQTTDQFE